MSLKYKISILVGMLSIAIFLIVFRPLIFSNSSVRDAEDCGPKLSARYGFDNLICENGSPNINAEKDGELRTNFSKIVNLQPDASASDIQNAICFYAIKDEAIRNRSLDVYAYIFAKYRWEKKQKSADEVMTLFFEENYCGDYLSNGKKYDLSNMSMEKRYRECVNLKQLMRNNYMQILQSLLKDDNELWAWFVYTNSIKESRRSFLSQNSIDLINEYRGYFDDYQILQCELNFPILKEQELQSNGQQLEPWVPSAIV